ncbi:MAG: L,D-transpeptidase family protein [Pseudomonadota bacterium]
MLAGPLQAAPPTDDVVGEQYFYAVQSEQTLMDVARLFGLGIAELIAANPEVDPWLPPAGAAVILPLAHVLPNAPRRGIVINLAEPRLYAYGPWGVKSYAIGIGRDGLDTPLGTTKVVSRIMHPAWYPTAQARADDPTLPRVVPPGPSNPLGDRALALGWSGYLIHGTNKPDGVGLRISRGCIRLYPEAIAALFGLTPTGTAVTVVNQPVKAGWRGDALYVEVHDPGAVADSFARAADAQAVDEALVRAVVTAAAGARDVAIDWRLVAQEARRPSGLARRISR